MTYIVFFGFGLLFLLVMFDELLLHEQVVFDPLQFQLPQATLGDGRDCMGWGIPEGSLAAASIPLFFFLRPTRGGGGIGFFLAASLRLFLELSFRFT